MANLLQEQSLRTHAKYLDKQLKKNYGKRMGFALLVYPFGDDERVSDYISNSQRSDMIKSLRETADRLERREDIPASKGSEQ